MWQRKTPEDKRCHRHILAPSRPTGKERYRNAADKGAIQAIAGHRGWRGADYFRHIDKLAVGDSVTLTNLHLAQDKLLELTDQMEQQACPDAEIERWMRELSLQLSETPGKHVYGYLPKPTKELVEQIVDRLARLPEVAACYEQWWKLKDEIAGYYGRNTPPHQPLVQQKEFRTIKNMIIQQAETFRQPVPEQAPIETEPDEQQVPLSSEAPVVVLQLQAVTSQIKIEGGAVIQLLHHMSRVFRGNMPVIPPALRIDSKRRRRLQEKRMAMGHKRDDHEDEQLYP